MIYKLSITREAYLFTIVLGFTVSEWLKRVYQHSFPDWEMTASISQVRENKHFCFCLEAIVTGGEIRGRTPLNGDIPSRSDR